MNNILQAIYGHVYDVSMSIFEQLFPINYELKSSNLHPDVIPVCYGGDVFLSHTTEE